MANSMVSATRNSAAIEGTTDKQDKNYRDLSKRLGRENSPSYAEDYFPWIEPVLIAAFWTPYIEP